MCKWTHLVVVFLCCSQVCFAIREYSKKDVVKLREEVREMFQHAYDSYLRFAYPYDELRPLSCDGVDTWGSYSLTLIDALDTLAIMGNATEFRRVVDIVLKRQTFDTDVNVSVFETNIRIIGGLLSAHLLSHKMGVILEPGWPCNGPLLRLAEDVAQRLITAFDTTTGMPYGTINLRFGIPPGETSVTCTAGVGTFIIEFGTLSRLTGDPIYEEVAYNALKALYHHRSPIGLLGNHIDVMTGRWTAQDAGIGGGVDSYYEYLVKGAILLEKPELMSMFKEARQVIDKYLKKDDWFVWATMLRGHVTLPVFQSLESYYPGLLTLIGESDTAMRIIHNYHSVWKQYGFTPEVYNLGTGEASSARESYPLRPELIESIMYLYRETRDPILLQMGEDILRSIQHSARTSCGYATIKDVRDHRKEDRMESFFLAETTKYLYLLFDPDNFIHNPGVHGSIINTPNGECVVDVGGYIFNTEAHPIDPSMLHCCHEARNGINISEIHRMYQILEEEDNVKIMTMIGASSNTSVVKDTEPNTNSSKETKATNASRHSKQEAEIKFDQNQVLIKTETKAGYVNLQGKERDQVEYDNALKDMLKEQIKFYYNATEAKMQFAEEMENAGRSEKEEPSRSQAKVEVDDIIVPQKPQEMEKLEPPSTRKAKATLNLLLPKVIQDFLNNDWKLKPKCEPQHLLERIRKEKKYPDHPDTHKYELLLTPSQSFLQRISLAGEFLSKNQLEM
ncbi:ER degradation-enhancing alpha-mannosidase-like protein 2 [Hyposmocoma kahamanoa]|uniref:ER degradation-enhancing alpha-mannosidase-like protein 2 n=1 Tax=Hyposmocoma kahamanoa TaxID=1477025 RepID=UPI000E6D9020|nr:ER degradation-enhancing alpha-mannosidase-like protein 2 [Hyposmocoma kahamanoa]